MRADRERRLDILEAIEKIRGRASDRKDFFADEMLQVWVIHHLQIIGEAAARLSKQLRDRHPGIPWPDIVNLRNILVHQYFGIDLDEIWDTLTSDLAKLQTDINTILQELQSPEQTF